MKPVSRTNYWGWLLGVMLLAGLSGCGHAEQASDKPKDKKEGAAMPSGKTELATFGEGCFWCSEALFTRVPGVKKVTSGYSGGTVANPSYKEVCTGSTGHAEVVQVEFDPGLVSYDKLLDVFFTTHDPTTLNQQGHDKGTQYRSVIFYHSDEQKKAAEASKEKWNKSGHWDNPVVTEITKAGEFYKAEGYHQDYFKLNPDEGYCRLVIAPKVEKFEKEQQKDK